MNTLNTIKNKLTLTETKAKKLKKSIALYAFAGAVACNGALTAFAGSTGDNATDGEQSIDTALESLKSLAKVICTGLGGIIALWGVVSFATSMTAQNAEQRKHGIIELIAGLMIAFAPSILSTLGVNI